MKNISVALATLAILLAMAAAAWAGDVVLMPDHGSLWKLAEECGQSGSTWEKIIAKNPWIKVKVVRGKRIPIVQPGQPIVLPDDWVVVSQEDEESNILASLWEDYLNIAKTYPVPSIIVFLLFGAVVTAKSYIPKPKKNAVQHTPQKNNRQHESIVLPG
jgi:hypothetical protein